MTRLRFRAAVNPATPNFNKVEDGAEIAFLPLEAVWTGSALDTSGRAIKSTVTSGYTRFQTGDVIVPKITPTFQAGRSAIVPDVPHGIAAGTTELHVVRPFGVDARYALYLVSSQPFLLGGEAEMTGVAGQKRVPDTWLRNFPVFVDDLFRQRLIADFLDRETHRIDALIEAKKKLIDLLAEKRTALITHAVTKGIDPTVPMKDSGVEWVGEVPAAWKATRLGRAIDGWYSGGTPESGNPRFWSDDPEDVAFVRIGDMSGREVVQETAQRVTSAGCQEKGLRILPTGTLIFAMYASMGEVAILGLRATINQALISLMPSSRTSVDWLYFWLRSIRPILPVYAKSTTQDNLSAETTLQLPLLLPPRDEQDMIVRKLRERTSMIESGMARLQEQLGLLNESRQALITAAVTGQLDESTLTGSKSTDEALRTELPA